MNRKGWILLLGVCVGIALLGHGEPFGEPCSTALLIVDTQNVWVLRGSMLTADGLPLLDRVAAALERFREIGVPVVYVKDTAWATAISSEKLAFPREIAPMEGEPVIRKRFPSAFRETNLDATLRDLGISHLVVCGLASDGCVQATVAEAVALGYGITILADVHSGGQDGSEAARMNEEWAEQGLSVLSLDGVDVEDLCANNSAGAAPAD